jgi:hypothetical protein
MRVSAESPPSPFDGAWFGLTLAVYSVIAGDRSPAQSLWIVALSSVAYLAAWWTACLTIFVFLAIEMSSLTLCAFAGGAVGGLIMSAATTFRLYAPNPGARGIRQACALAGGVLGVAGVMQAAVPDSRPLQMSAPVLCVVWQTGMGLVLGLTAPGDTGIR